MLDRRRIYPQVTKADTSFIKQVGFADFYFGTKNYPHKMGIVQSLAVPGPLMTAKMSPFVPAAVRQFLRKRILLLMGLIEDLPNPANRVTLGRDNKGKLTHRYGKYDLARRKHLTLHIARILKRSGAVYCLSGKFSAHEHVAHQCGTLRFGNDPAHAVLDADCRTVCESRRLRRGRQLPADVIGGRSGPHDHGELLRVAAKVAAEL